MKRTYGLGPQGEVNEAGEVLIAVCPACGGGTVVERIPTLRPLGEQIVALGCELCGAAFHIVADIGDVA